MVAIIKSCTAEIILRQCSHSHQLYLAAHFTLNITFIKVLKLSQHDSQWFDIVSRKLHGQLS